jgi:hypothetical protein
MYVRKVVKSPQTHHLVYMVGICSLRFAFALFCFALLGPPRFASSAPLPLAPGHIPTARSTHTFWRLAVSSGEPRNGRGNGRGGDGGGDFEQDLDSSSQTNKETNSGESPGSNLRSRRLLACKRSLPPHTVPPIQVQVDRHRQLALAPHSPSCLACP